jgi:hypothetical protein
MTGIDVYCPGWLDALTAEICTSLSTTTVMRISSLRSLLASSGDLAENVVGNCRRGLDAKDTQLRLQYGHRGCVLASGSFMLCLAFNVLLRGLTGRDVAAPAGPDLVSARSVQAMQRLVHAARCDPDVTRRLEDTGAP